MCVPSKNDCVVKLGLSVEKFLMAISCPQGKKAVKIRYKETFLRWLDHLESINKKYKLLRLVLVDQRLLGAIRVSWYNLSLHTHTE